MKFRTMLLASAAVMFAGSAAAADLTNPFYLPSQGNIASDTTVSYNRTEFDHSKDKDDAWSAKEEITYGVTDNLAVFGSIENEFDSEGEYNNDHNYDYEIGAAYNMSKDGLLAQIRGSYATYNPKDFDGKRYYSYHNENGRWQKYLNADIKLGYDMGEGLIPYMMYGFNGQIDAADREFDQYAFAGVHKYAGNWAVDGGFRYEFNTDGKNSNALYAQAEVDYYPVDNLALGLFGDYYLSGSGDVDEDYTTGLRAKVEF